MPCNTLFGHCRSLIFWLRQRARVTVISEGPYCACSERVNCVMVPGVSMTSLKIDMKASRCMNETQGKRKLGNSLC